MDEHESKRDLTRKRIKVKEYERKMCLNVAWSVTQEPSICRVYVFFVLQDPHLNGSGTEKRQMNVGDMIKDASITYVGPRFRTCPRY